MNVTLAHDTRPYEETRNRISILVSTFNKFILSKHEPNEQETQEIYKQWKALDNKTGIRSPSMSPTKSKKVIESS